MDTPSTDLQTIGIGAASGAGAMWFIRFILGMLQQRNSDQDVLLRDLTQKLQAFTDEIRATMAELKLQVVAQEVTLKNVTGNLDGLRSSYGPDIRSLQQQASLLQHRVAVLERALERALEHPVMRPVDGGTDALPQAPHSNP